MWRGLGGVKPTLFLYHPLTVHFPIALWLTSALFDVLFVLRREPWYGETAKWLIGLGLLGAGVAIGLGFVDLNRQVALGVGPGILIQHRIHSWLAYLATATYLISFLGRRSRPTPPRWALLLAIPGALLIAATGYVGSQLRQVM